MDTTDQLLVVIVILLAATQVIVLLLSAVILLHIRRLSKHWSDIMSDSRSILYETSRRLQQGKPLYAIGNWLFNKFKERSA